MSYSLIKSSPRAHIEDSPEMNLKKVIYFLKYRKWMIIFLFIVISSGIMAFGKYLPKTYRASATVLFEPKDISRDFVRSVIDMPMEKRLLNISKKAKSRSHIRQVIREFQLNRGITNPKELENMITQMQEEKINVEESKNEAFTISYLGSEPQLTMQVANRITDLFIEEQQQDSQRRAKTAALLLGREMKKAEQLLKVQEAKIEEFRRKYMGELPEQEEFNLKMLDRLQLQLRDNEHALQSAQEQKQFLEKHLSPLGSLPDERSEYSLPPGYRRLEELKAELARLQRKYSDRWLEIKEIKREIAGLEQELGIDSPVSLKDKPANKVSPASQEVRDKIAKINKTIDNLNKERERFIGDMQEYNRRVENLPKRKQELAGLTEKYNLLKGDYESLRLRKLDAKLSEDFESARGSGYFTVLERAELPLEPFKPDMQRLMLIALLAGLGGGVGMAVFREHLDDSLKDPDEVESYLGLSVIGLIPVLKTSRIARQARIRRIRYAMFLCLYLLGIWLLVRYKEPARSFTTTRNIHNIPDSTSDQVEHLR